MLRVNANISVMLVMSDVIYISSGSEYDSDLEIKSSYKEDREDAVPFFQAEWRPDLIDVTDHSFTAVKERVTRRDPCTFIEEIDLTEKNLDNGNIQITSKAFQSFGKHLKSQTEIDMKYPKQLVKSEVQSAVRDFNSEDYIFTDSLQRTENPLQLDANFRPLSSKHFNPPWHLDDFLQNTYLKDPEALQESLTNATPNSGGTEIHLKDVKREVNLALVQNLQDSGCSPYSLDSPNYCPSEMDDYLPTKYKDDKQSTQFSETHTSSDFSFLLLKEDDIKTIKNEGLLTQNPSQFPSHSLHPSLKWLEWKSNENPNSSTSTEILPSDTENNLSVSYPPECFQSHWKSPEKAKSIFWETSSNHQYLENYSLSDHSDNSPQEKQEICLSQYRKLSKCVAGAAPQMFYEDVEICGGPEPICPQSLSLVYCTIEEDYPEGTVQLLSDFIQPQNFPPVEITTHLLRGIFLDRRSTPHLVLEAFNLLMKTQRYHPADSSTIPWDWELVKSFMNTQDESSRSWSVEISSMFLQYVLQCLEDDFHIKLPTRNLQRSLAKKMLSCSHQTFAQVQDVISWMLHAAKESVNHTKEHSKKEGEHFKIISSLQRMLSLSLEVDLDPSYNSDKLSDTFFCYLNTVGSCRKTRLLVLNSLESKLLKFKLLKLLLDEACDQKSGLLMSAGLITHYLKISALPSDPCVNLIIHSGETWRKWDELLQLLWMLLLSYDEVMAGHLLRPITKRFEKIQAPSWTHANPVKISEVCEAADEFLNRAKRDIGQSLPMETRNLLSQLQELILEQFNGR